MGGGVAHPGQDRRQLLAGERPDELRPQQEPPKVQPNTVNDPSRQIQRRPPRPGGAEAKGDGLPGPQRAGRHQADPPLGDVEDHRVEVGPPRGDRKTAREQALAVRRTERRRASASPPPAGDGPGEGGWPGTRGVDSSVSWEKSP